jgi:hypothetical protein
MPREALKILVKVAWMRASTLSQVKTPTSSHSQEEEDKLHMITMDPTRSLTPSLKKLIATIIIITETRKISVKVTLMRRFMELLLLILMFFQCQEEEDKLPMPTMDQERKPIHSMRELITRETLEKEILMRRFTELLLLILMFFQCQEEEDKPLMPTMAPERRLIHLLRDLKKILEKETSMKKFMVSLLLILTFSQCQGEEDKQPMPTMDPERKLTH